MLYSTAVYFSAKEDITFMSYEVEDLHGFLFKILSKMDPNLASQVHERLNKQFTLSNFMPFTSRRKDLKVLEKDKEYKFRITFLDEEVFSAFLTYFVKSSEPLFLKGVRVQIIKIITNDPDEDWSGETTFDELLNAETKGQVNFKFLTPTSFRRGDRNVILPLPELVFGSLLQRWEQAGGPALSLRDSGELEKIEISKYELKTRKEKFKNYSIKGFTGECEYWIGSLSEEHQREVMALARFAFYVGVGYKTTMGLGQVARVGVM